MNNRNYRKDQLIMMPFALIAIAIFVLFQYWNPLPNIPISDFNFVYWIIGPAILAIPWIVLSIVLVNVFIKSLRAWSYMTILFIPFGYWYWVTEVMCTGGFYCSPSVNGAFLGKLYLIASTITIVIVYSRAWFIHRKRVT